MCKISCCNLKPDIIIVGTGAAGFSAAICASELNAKVLLVGNGTIGGTCVNFGCIPSKAMIRAVESIYKAKHVVRFEGIKGNASLNNWKQLVDQKQNLVDTLRQTKYIDLLNSYPNIAYIEGTAQLAKGGVTH